MHAKCTGKQACCMTVHMDKGISSNPKGLDIASEWRVNLHPGLYAVLAEESLRANGLA
jgi:hypothetical protein